MQVIFNNNPIKHFKNPTHANKKYDQFLCHILIKNFIIFTSLSVPDLAIQHGIKIREKPFNLPNPPTME